MLSAILTIFLALHTYAFPASDTHNPPRAQVDLGYATYQGNALANGLNEFLGVRFAAPPLGNLRFRVAQPPPTVHGVQNATAFQPQCLGIETFTNEDCLFANIYAPANATPRSKLPVMFWIQGGGYIANQNGNYNASELIGSSGNQFIFVGINYRVGAFGFLAGEKVRQGGVLNAGLLDQRVALQWVKQHISAFGGDPNHVVLVGDSAGAGSIALHLTAYNARPTDLFIGAFGISPFFPTQPKCSELEWQFTNFVKAAGCSSARDAMACLRGKDINTLVAANAPQVYPGRTNATLWGFTPCVDGDLIADYPVNMFKKGKFLKMPVVFGDDTNEGTDFAVNATGPADISGFFRDNFPKLSEQQADSINAQYPLVDAPLPMHNKFFPAAAAAYGDSVFTCAGLLISDAYAPTSAPTWNYRFNIASQHEIELGLNVSHVSEVAWIFGFASTTIPLTPVLRSYYTSFVRKLDPNAFPIAGSKPWPRYENKAGGPVRLLLQGDDQGGVKPEGIPNAQRDNCKFWGNLAVTMEQ